MALKRDTENFLAVTEQHKGIIYKIANAYCRNGEDRKDLIQEIILQLWLSFNRYDEQYRLSTWIYRIALNVSISFYSKEIRRTKLNHPIPENLLVLQEESNRQTGQQLGQLQQFIRELNELDRAVILLYLEGSSQQETAKILGLTPTNVSTKVARIKQKLQQKFIHSKT